MYVLLHNTGAWYGILDVISKLSIVTNAFIIAVTAEFIPILVYQYGSSSDAKYVISYVVG